MKKKGSSIAGGFLVLLLGIGLLWWNEGNNVSNLRSVSEGLKNYVDVSSTEVDNENEGKLVATSGKITFNLPASDSEFEITSNSAVLMRKAEMYQWQEKCEADDDNNKTCTYEKVWSDVIIDSTMFERAGHDNPTSMLYNSFRFYGSDVKLGAFEMTNNLLDKLSTKKQIVELNEEAAKNHAMVVDKYYYTSVTDGNPDIGDIRISFYENNAEYVSVLAMQSGNHFKEYRTKAGKVFFNLYESEYNGADMFQLITKQNNFSKWVFRFIGVLCVMLGVGSLFSPLQNLTGGIPILGSLVGMATGTISFVLGLAISLLVIAVAWFRFRPFISIILILIVMMLFFLLKNKKKNNFTNVQKQ